MSIEKKNVPLGVGTPSSTKQTTNNSSIMLIDKNVKREKKEIYKRSRQMLKCTLCGLILEAAECIITHSDEYCETYVICPECHGECVDYDEEEESNKDEEQLDEEEALYYSYLPPASDINVLAEAIRTNGCDRQIDVAIEEMGELIQALIKEKRESTAETQEHIAEEMGDVVIMLLQLQLIFDNKESVREYIEMKTERLKKRLEEIK